MPKAEPIALTEPKLEPVSQSSLRGGSGQATVGVEDNAAHSMRRPSWSRRIVDDEPLRKARDSVVSRIETLRSGRSFREFAELLGPVSFSHESVRRYLSHQGDPPLTFLVAVIRATGVNPIWLLLGDGSPTAESSLQNGLPGVPMASLLAELATRLQAAQHGPAALDAESLRLLQVLRAIAGVSPQDSGKPAHTNGAHESPVAATRLRAKPLQSSRSG